MICTARTRLQRTIGDSKSPKDAIDEKGAIEFLPHDLDVLDEFGITVGRNPLGLENPVGVGEVVHRGSAGDDGGVKYQRSVMLQ